MIIENITSGLPTTKKAALFFKTEAYFVDVNKYVHTNNWEILASIKILNLKGYSVDLIDRSVANWSPKHKYDLYLGLGVGNSGRHFARYAKISQAPKKVLLAYGSQPDKSNKRNIDRYKYFEQRTGVIATPMRRVTEVVGENFKKIIDEATHIITNSEAGTHCHNSYIDYGLPMFTVYSSCHPGVFYNKEWLNTRKNNSFLCFAGNGFIHKGVDLIVECFLKNTNKELHLCGPDSDKSFFAVYGKKINDASNIFYHGFIEPGSESFNKLASHCSFVLLCSASESSSTSVTTAMRAGIVPVINSWTNVNIDNIGIQISEDGDIMENIEAATNSCLSLGKEKYEKLVSNTIKKASLFSQESHVESFSNAIDAIEK